MVLPSVTFDEKVDTATAMSIHDKREGEEELPDDLTFTENKKPHNPALMTGVAVGAVVGAIVIGPIVTGAIILGGAAVYVVNRKKDEPGQTRDIFDKASVVVKEFDEKYKITTTATKVVNAGVEKCREIDDKTHISETVQNISTTIATKCKEADEKYHIKEKTNQAVNSAAVAIQSFDEKHQITAKAQATAVTAVNKAKELDSKYEVTSSISKAFTSFSNSVTQLTKDAVNSIPTNNNSNHTSDAKP